ncbi:hypothetical protein B0T25DRAFT_232244 [Lasiosphaeria hispida]|uniref:Uncharacterized protein n=1 Tax=Lasiosphaeria hispida TaxID=260671 RepID=A0AAJ0MCA5_9PEZI|nr:hypothetical protein B0T25DRAFT_232244 [Lasiosphaeria hispida]
MLEKEHQHHLIAILWASFHSIPSLSLIDLSLAEARERARMCLGDECQVCALSVFEMPNCQSFRKNHTGLQRGASRHLAVVSGNLGYVFLSQTSQSGQQPMPNVHTAASPSFNRVRRSSKHAVMDSQPECGFQVVSSKFAHLSVPPARTLQTPMAFSNKETRSTMRPVCQDLRCGEPRLPTASFPCFSNNCCQSLERCYSRFDFLYLKHGDRHSRLYEELASRCVGPQAASNGLNYIFLI